MGAVLKAVENYRLRSVTMKDREARLEKTINRHLPLRSAAPMSAKKAEGEAVRTGRKEGSQARWALITRMDVRSDR